MIDLHCHLLPGIDDGPVDVEGALAMARAQVAAGIEQVVCTPHVTHDLPNDARTIGAAVRATQAALDHHRIPLVVLPGAEIELTVASALPDDDLAALGLGGGPWLLVEAPLRVATGVELVVQALAQRGHRVLLAHPERSPAFHRDVDALRRLMTAGVLVQVTTGSLVGRFGSTVQRFAQTLFDERLVHNVASDAHDAQRRPPGLVEPMHRAGWDELTRWATHDVPAALLKDVSLPPDPRTPPLGLPPRTGLFGRRGRRGAARR